MNLVNFHSFTSKLAEPAILRYADSIDTLIDSWLSKVVSINYFDCLPENKARCAGANIETRLRYRNTFSFPNRFPPTPPEHGKNQANTVVTMDPIVAAERFFVNRLLDGRFVVVEYNIVSEVLNPPSWLE